MLMQEKLNDLGETIRFLNQMDKPSAFSKPKTTPPTVCRRWQLLLWIKMGMWIIAM